MFRRRREKCGLSRTVTPSPHGLKVSSSFSQLLMHYICMYLFIQYNNIFISVLKNPTLLYFQRHRWIVGSIWPAVETGWGLRGLLHLTQQISPRWWCKLARFWCGLFTVFHCGVLALQFVRGRVVFVQMLSCFHRVFFSGVLRLHFTKSRQSICLCWYSFPV